MKQQEVGLGKVSVDIAPSELVRWVREEKAAGHGHLDFFERTWKTYFCEEEFDRTAYGVEGNLDVDLISVEAVLNIEPLVEQNYWILQVKVTDEIGPRPVSEEGPYASGDLSLDSFEDEFLKTNVGKTEVCVYTQTPLARAHFDTWFSTMQAEHRH